MARTRTTALLLLGVFVRALGWKECATQLDARWEPAAPRSMSERMLVDYERRYTCTFRPGALAAASYTFRSACTSKTFTTAETASCLEGRRVVFLGDSMSTQQSDSLLGMLGWHPGFLTLGHPQNSKFKQLPDGTQGLTLLECWRDPVHSAGRSERCYDIVGSTVPRTGVRRLVAKDTNSWDSDQNGGPRRQSTAARGKLRPQHRTLEGADVDVREAALELGGEKPDTAQETSVHVRMFPVPKGGNWLERAVSDFNQTRASDIFVINFGAHYHDTAEADESFKADVAPILDDMARLGETATVIWREIAPSHFPSSNGSYDSFQSLPNSEKAGACCTGTPPPVLDRNVWVETYLRENGLADRVKLLKIYRMSYFRGSAHHTCHEASPTTPNEGPPRDVICPATHEPTDCRHFSETGVVEAWNGLMLNHLCPA